MPPQMQMLFVGTLFFLFPSFLFATNIVPGMGSYVRWTFPPPVDPEGTCLHSVKGTLTATTVTATNPNDFTPPPNPYYPVTEGNISAAKAILNNRENGNNPYVYYFGQQLPKNDLAAFGQGQLKGPGSIFIGQAFDGEKPSIVTRTEGRPKEGVKVVYSNSDETLPTLLNSIDRLNGKGEIVDIAYIIKFTDPVTKKTMTYALTNEQIGKLRGVVSSSSKLPAGTLPRFNDTVAGQHVDRNYIDLPASALPKPLQESIKKGKFNLPTGPFQSFENEDISTSGKPYEIKELTTPAYRSPGPAVEVSAGTPVNTDDLINTINKKYPGLIKKHPSAAPGQEGSNYNAYIEGSVKVPPGSMKGIKVLVPIFNGFMDIEVILPIARFIEAGAEVKVVSSLPIIQETHGSIDGIRWVKPTCEFKVGPKNSTKNILDKHEKFDVIFLAGGGHHTFTGLADENLKIILDNQLKSGKLVVTNCNGALMLGGSMAGRHVASSPTTEELVNALGGAYMPKAKVVVDHNLISSTSPKDMNLLISTVIEQLKSAVDLH